MTYNPELVDPEHPNDPLREVMPAECWPPGQPPVTPLSVWGPSGGGTIDRAWYWTPELLRGYVPVLKRLSIRVKSLTTGLYSAAVSPRLLIAFLDPNDPGTPIVSQEYFGLPSPLLVDPLSAEPLFFAEPGTVGIVNATNNGKGYEFPMRTPMRYHGIWVSGIGIGTRTQMRVTPVINYIEKGVGQGG